MKFRTGYAGFHPQNLLYSKVILALEARTKMRNVWSNSAILPHPRLFKYCACISHNVDFVESGHLAVALDAEPAAGVLRVNDVDKFRSEAGGAHEAPVDVVAGGVLAAVVSGDSTRVDDADALRNGLRNVPPD